MIKLLCLLICGPLVICAQEKRGINFEHGISWKQVLDKARTEGKLIFVDCYASWCGPCKEMDKKVYLNEKVGSYMNEKFISIKVRMDTSKNDNEMEKSWYSDARSIEYKFKVNAYPTLLFLASDGSLLHRAAGAYDADGFISLASDALNPEKQYSKLLASYVEGKRDSLVMKQLAISTIRFGDTALGRQIAKDFINTLRENNLYTKENISFIINFTKSSNDKGFAMVYRHTNKVNKTMDKEGYAQGVVNYIITKEEIDPIVVIATNSGLDPNWTKIIINITKKYNSTYAIRAVTSAKVRWYESKKNWPEYCKNLVVEVEKYGADLWYVFLNNNAWYLFLHSNDTTILKKALSWSKRALDSDPYWSTGIDTYANLLYKLGNVTDAITWEEIAVKLDQSDEIFNSTLKKMKGGEPTWRVPEESETQKK